MYSIGTSYGKSQSTTAKDNSLDKLTTFTIFEWFTILIFPAASNNLVALIPISITLPLKPSIEIVSPVLNSFSKIINTPSASYSYAF